MDLSNICCDFSHSKILKDDYLNFNKGGRMKKVGIVITLLALLGGSANAGTTTCYTNCYGNSCTVTCYDY